MGVLSRYDDVRDRLTSSTTWRYDESSSSDESGSESDEFPGLKVGLVINSNHCRLILQLSTCLGILDPALQL